MKQLIFITILLSFFEIRAQDTIYSKSGFVKFIGNSKENQKVGFWYEFNEKADTINKIQFLSDNKIKIYPIKTNKYAIEYVYGFFRNDSLIKEGEYYRKEKSSVTEGYYVNNNLYGTWKHYENGKLFAIDIYGKGTNIQTLFFKDNHLTVIANTEDGLSVIFDKKGYLKELGEYKNNCKVGIWKYYKQGILLEQGRYFNDYITVKQIGKQKKWFIVNKEDKLAESIFSKKIIESFVKNNGKRYYLKDKKWKYWNLEGVLIKEEIWNKGELVETKEY